MSNQKDSGGQNSDPCIGTKNCIKHLLLLYERIELRHFTQKYKECFKTEFVCPKGKKHALATCLKEHFKADLELCRINGTVTVCRKQDEIVPYNPSLNEFPTLSEAMKIQPNAKHKNSSSKNSTKPQMPSSLSVGILVRSPSHFGMHKIAFLLQDISSKFICVELSIFFVFIKTMNCIFQLFREQTVGCCLKAIQSKMCRKNSRIKSLIQKWT